MGFGEAGRMTASHGRRPARDRSAVDIVALRAAPRAPGPRRPDRLPRARVRRPPPHDRPAATERRRHRLHARPAARRDGRAARAELLGARCQPPAGHSWTRDPAAQRQRRWLRARRLAARHRALGRRSRGGRGLPLWRLLGGARARVPVMAVAGYHARRAGRRRGREPRSGRSSTPASGCSSCTRPTSTVIRVAAPRAASRAARRRRRAWHGARCPRPSRPAGRLDDLGLAFIEDPVPAGPLAADRPSSPTQLAHAARGGRGCRRSGSASSTCRWRRRAAHRRHAPAAASTPSSAPPPSPRSAARRVMTHAFPDLHAHLAGSAAVEMVEMIPDAAGANPVGRLLARRQRIEDGQLRPLRRARPRRPARLGRRRRPRARRAISVEA